jgi:hypothetical protein
VILANVSVRYLCRKPLIIVDAKVLNLIQISFWHAYILVTFYSCLLAIQPDEFDEYERGLGEIELDGRFERENIELAHDQANEGQRKGFAWFWVGAMTSIPEC